MWDKNQWLQNARHPVASHGLVASVTLLCAWGNLAGMLWGVKKGGWKGLSTTEHVGHRGSQAVPFELDCKERLGFH